MEEAYKDKCFDECTIFRRHGEFKKERLPVKPTNVQLGQLESVVNDKNVNTVQENW